MRLIVLSLWFSSVPHWAQIELIDESNNMYTFVIIILESYSSCGRLPMHWIGGPMTVCTKFDSIRHFVASNNSISLSALLGCTRNENNENLFDLYDQRFLRIETLKVGLTSAVQTTKSWAALGIDFLHALQRGLQDQPKIFHREGKQNLVAR